MFAVRHHLISAVADWELLRPRARLGGGKRISIHVVRDEARTVLSQVEQFTSIPRPVRVLATVGRNLPLSSGSGRCCREWPHKNLRSLAFARCICDPPPVRRKCWSINSEF